ncbi:MAG: hypothetical protein R6V83_00015 [Candidatus Thorarchaeota archaeon]
MTTPWQELWKTSLLPGVMTRDNDRRQKPGPREEPCSGERGQSPC